MDEKNTSPIFAQAKMEYTTQLIDILNSHVFDGIKSIYDEAKTIHNVNRNKPILVLFRSFLEKVPSWSNVIIESELERIIKMSKCDWLDDLLTAVFISHTKILTSIGTNNGNMIDLTIPKSINFIHKCYINVAREVWKNPYLFNEYVSASEYQKNMRIIELIIKDSITNTIRNLLPIKEILKQHLSDYDTNNYTSKKQLAKQDLRNLLLDEIKNLNLEKIISLNKETKNDEESSDEEDELSITNTEDKKNDEIDESEDEEEEKEEEKEKENELQIMNNNTEKIDVVEDYESPDEEEIEKKCENITINTIDESEIKEEIYDNEDITKEEKPNESTLENFLNHLTENQEETKDIEESNEIIQQDKIIEQTPIIEKPSILEHKPIIDEVKSIIQEIKTTNDDIKQKNDDIKQKNEEEREEDDKVPELPKMKEIPIISVDKHSDTETIDDFFQDITKIMEKKGKNINKKMNNYTLFDDAENDD